MKLVAILSVLLLGASALDQKLMEEVLAKAAEVTGRCTAKEHATPDDIAQLLQFNVPESHSAKCVLACFYEEYDALKEDGKTWDTEAAIAPFEPMKSQNEDLYEKVVGAIKVCHSNAEVTDDRCENASLMTLCFKKEAEAMGMKMEMFFGA